MTLVDHSSGNGKVSTVGSGISVAGSGGNHV